MGKVLIDGFDSKIDCRYLNEFIEHLLILVVNNISWFVLSLDLRPLLLLPSSIPLRSPSPMPGRRNDMVMAGAAMASIAVAVSIAPSAAAPAISPAAAMSPIPSMSWRTDPRGPKKSRRGEPSPAAIHVSRRQEDNI